jgi:hypothetical protein
MSVTLTHLLGFLLDVSHFTTHILLFPVVADYAFDRCCILDPLDKSCVSAQRNNRECPQFQVSLSGFTVIIQHFIAQNCKVDEPLLLSQIAMFVTLEQEVVHSVISAKYANLLWSFFRDHNRNFLKETLNHHWRRFEGRELWALGVLRVL